MRDTICFGMRILFAILIALSLPSFAMFCIVFAETRHLLESSKGVKKSTSISVCFLRLGILLLPFFEVFNDFIKQFPCVCVVGVG